MGRIFREFKNKPKDMKISVYLIHTRLIAQGTVVGFMTVGMIGQMWKNWQKMNPSPSFKPF